MTGAAVVDVDVDVAAVGFSDGAVSPSLRCEPAVDVLVVAGLVVVTGLVVAAAADVRVADARKMLVEVS